MSLGDCVLITCQSFILTPELRGLGSLISLFHQETCEKIKLYFSHIVVHILRKTRIYIETENDNERNI